MLGNDRRGFRPSYTEETVAIFRMPHNFMISERSIAAVFLAVPYFSGRRFRKSPKGWKLSAGLCAPKWPWDGFGHRVAAFDDLPTWKSRSNLKSLHKSNCESNKRQNSSAQLPEEKSYFDLPKIVPKSRTAYFILSKQTDLNFVRFSYKKKTRSSTLLSYSLPYLSVVGSDFSRRRPTYRAYATNCQRTVKMEIVCSRRENEPI